MLGYLGDRHCFLNNRTSQLSGYFFETGIDYPYMLVNDLLSGNGQGEIKRDRTYTT